MNQFTASNGIVVEHIDNGDQIGLTEKKPGRDYKEWTGGRFTQALREFFRAEEDERLGRWRWPENPDYVVYPDDDGDVRVAYLATGSELGFWGRGSVMRYPTSMASKAAQAYFDAQPVPKPAWHDAADGEVWVIEVEGIGEFPTHVDRDEFPRFVSLEDGMGYGPRAGIIAARRIWPPEES